MTILIQFLVLFFPFGMFSTFSRWVRVLKLSALVVSPPWTFLLLEDLSGNPIPSHLIFPRRALRSISSVLKIGLLL